jgi:hypothetical protein
VNAASLVVTPRRTLAAAGLSLAYFYVLAFVLLCVGAAASAFGTPVSGSEAPWQAGFSFFAVVALWLTAIAAVGVAMMGLPLGLLAGPALRRHPRPWMATLAAFCIGVISSATIIVAFVVLLGNGAGAAPTADESSELLALSACIVLAAGFSAGGAWATVSGVLSRRASIATY